MHDSPKRLHFPSCPPSVMSVTYFLSVTNSRIILTFLRGHMQNVSDATAMDRDITRLHHGHRFAPRTVNHFPLRPYLHIEELPETPVAPTIQPTVATKSCGTQTPTTVAASNNFADQPSIASMVTSIIEAHLKSVAVDILSYVSLTHTQYERLRHVLSFTPKPEKEEWLPKRLHNNNLGKYTQYSNIN